jgi:hypothetical protein
MPLTFERQADSMSLPNKPPPSPARQRRLARPWERPDTEFPAVVPIDTFTGGWVDISYDDEPDSPFQYPGGSVIRSHREDGRWWVWPLPPPGRLDFICRLGAAKTRVSIDAQLILDASQRSMQAWPNA